MIPESLTSFPHASTHAAALAARTSNAVTDDPPMRNSISVTERVNAYGLNADVVTTAGVSVHNLSIVRSVAPLQTATGVVWLL